jgi:predicted outer membrane repeat protein
VNNSGHGNLLIERSTFRGNRTEADGGAIYSTGGTLTITGSTISDNQAHGGVYSAGASIWELGRIELWDAGADSDVDTAEDNRIYATQGVFVP